MAQHVHKFAPGASLTLAVEAAVTAARLVMVTGDNQVSPATATSTSWIGAAATDAAVGEQVLVLRGGVQEIICSGAVTAGDLVVAAADGTVASLAAVTTPTAGDVTGTRAIVGTALVGGADGAVVRVAMAR